MTRPFLPQALTLVWTLFFTLGVAPLCAQDYLANVRQFTTAEGLSNDQVLALLQDSDGYIWIGTKYGLNRFDGHTFRVYTKESHGLQSNIVNQLIEGPGGRIWLLRSQESLGDYVYYSIDLLDPIRGVVAPWEEVLPTLPFTLDQVERIFDVPEGVLFQLEDLIYYLFDDQGAFGQVALPRDFQFFNSPVAGHFFGKQQNRYVTYDREGREVRSFRLRDSMLVANMVPDPEGNYWCLAGLNLPNERRIQLSNLLKVSPSGKVSVEDELDQTDSDVFFTSFRQGRSLLYIQQNEIREYVLATGQVLVNQEALQGRSIIFPGEVLIDQQDGLWIGDYLGLRVLELNVSRFATYLKDQDEKVSARGMALKGTELIYTYPTGPHFLDLNTRRSTPIEPDEDILFRPSPFSVLQIENDQLVFGGKQLIKVDEEYRIQKVSDLSEFGGNRIWSFSRDRDGRYWMGFGKENILVLDPDFETYRRLDHNGNEDAGGAIKWHFLEDGDYMWIAAQNGLFLAHKKRGIIAQFGANASEEHYLPAIIFHFIHQDAEGTYWLATGDGGLIKFTYDPEDPSSPSYQQFRKKDGLPSLELYAILEDEQGSLWISSSNGLVQFDPQTEEVLVYNEAQGIAHNEFNRLSYYQHSDGRIFLGGLNGITAFDPGDFFDQEAYEVPLRLAAASLRTFGSDSLQNILAGMLESQPLILYPKDDFLQLEFSLQDYFYSDRISYSYRIPGVRDQWSVLDGNRLQLAGLPYGTHSLEVRARGRMNKVSAGHLQLELIVSRPVYFRWWFISLALLTVGVSVWQYTNWRNRSLVRQQQALERIVAERTKQIQEDKRVIEEQARQLLELDEMKSQFFENVSHELRTPLTLILGPLEKVLKRNKLESRDFALLSLMKENAKSLHKRINELLDLSRIDAVRMSLQPEPVILYPFVKNILAQFEGSARLHTVNLLFDYQLDRDLRVMLDRDKVEKILFNLLSNAIKFTPAGGEVQLLCKDEKGQLIFRVSDTGIGIAEPDLPRIFQRFHRAKTDAHYEGTGIGLSLCKELAELMKGQISARSVQGEGSVFVVKIPLTETFATTTEPEAVQTGTDLADLSEEVLDISGDPILVVEDNPSMREYLRLTLEDFHVKTTGHGREALEVLENGFVPALIITDIMMPVMDGMEFLKAIREMDAFRNVPVIMLTAKTGSTNKVEALRVGVDDYLTKPFVEEELIARVQALIRNSRQRTAATGKPSAEKETPVISKADLKWIKEVEQLIMSHVGDTLFGIDQLAETLELSTRRVQQRIKEITGLTPKQYQREIQLESARRLLEEGNFQSVTDVCRQMGFSDAHYFSKIYEKRFGKRPSDYL